MKAPGERTMCYVLDLSTSFGLQYGKSLGQRKRQSSERIHRKRITQKQEEEKKTNGQKIEFMAHRMH